MLDGLAEKGEEQLQKQLVSGIILISGQLNWYLAALLHIKKTQFLAYSHCGLPWIENKSVAGQCTSR